MKVTTVITVVVFVVAILTSAAVSQNVQISGGDSTLYQAGGGQVTAYFRTSETAVSGGILNDHFYFGAVEKMTVKRWELAAGDVSLPFTLPTDFTPATFQFPSIGILASHKSDGSKLSLFAGATATSYSAPFFFGSTAETKTAGAFYEKTLTPRLKFLSDEILSSKRQTAIQSLSFTPDPRLVLSCGAGLGNNSPFAAVRVGWTSPSFTGVVSYAHHGVDFQRIVLPYQTVTENSGLNARGMVTRKHWSLFADHENALGETKNQVFHSTVNSFGAGGGYWILSANATQFLGTTNGQPVSGRTANVGATLGPVSGQVYVYSTRQMTSHAIGLIEKVTRRFSVSEFIQSRNVSLGGSWRSNAVTVDAGESMSWLPATGQFARVLSVTVSIQLPHAVKANFGTLATPDGKVRWTTYADHYLVGPLDDVPFGGGSSGHSIGRYMYTGRCVTESGEPILCAVKIGKTMVYADSTGTFRLPTKKLKTQSVIVVPEDFISSGAFAVTSAPSEMTPESPVTIVVKRKV